MGNELIDPRTDLDNVYDDPDSLLGGGVAKGDHWGKGFTAFEAGEEIVTGIARGIESGDWIEAELGLLAGGLDLASAAFDPLAYVSGQIASYAMEHLEPLRKVLHGLAGEPSMVDGYANTWHLIAERMSAVGAEYLAAVERDTAYWSGDAAASYRKHAERLAALARSTSKAAETLKTSAEMAKELVAGVRTMVRDIIAALVGTLVSSTVKLVATAGLAAPAVEAQTMVAIARASGRVSKLLIQLGESVGNLASYLVALRDILDGVYKEFRVLAESR